MRRRQSAREGERGQNEAGERERLLAGLKRSWGEWAGDVAELLIMCARWSTAVAEKTRLTGWAHGAKAQARGRRHLALTRRAHIAERESGERGRRQLESTDRPHRAEGERERGRASWAELGRNLFSFFLNFEMYFLFIFSIEFNSNSTPIQIQIIQTCASNKKNNLGSS
jgi:hypothetical protein